MSSTYKTQKMTVVIGCVFVAMAIVLLAITLNHSWLRSEVAFRVFLGFCVLDVLILFAQRPIHLVEGPSSAADIVKSVKYYLKSAIADRLEDVQASIAVEQDCDRKCFDYWLINLWSETFDLSGADHAKH